MALTYRIQLIPTSRPQRTGKAMTARSFTVHNTANPDATADNHADYECNNNLTTSYHAVVDDHECVFLLPFDEQAWHAGDGDGPGNTTSLAMEVCEFSDTARTLAAIRNAERVIADAMTGKTPAGFRCEQLDGDDIVPHRVWSGKFCPRVILSSYGWDRFVAETKTLIGGTMPEEVTYRVMCGMCEDEAAMRELAAQAAGLGLTFKTLGPSWYAHANIAKCKTLETFIGSKPKIHRFHSILTPKNTAGFFGIPGGEEFTKPWVVVDPAQVGGASPDTAKLANAQAKSLQIEQLANEIQAL